MKTLTVKKIKPIDRAESVSAAFDNAPVPYNNVETINWPEYPYKPDVRFRIAHDGRNIYINWQVNEIEIKAVCEKDFGEVWKDSCVEFFVSFKNSVYYNIECNCIGKMLVATGADRHNRIPVASSEVEKAGRWSSLGSSPVEGKSGQWELSLILPKELFYLDGITAFDGLTAKGNFYKCGDDLRQPHFVTWNAVGSKTPDYHLSAYFGGLSFE